MRLLILGEGLLGRSLSNEALRTGVRFTIVGHDEVEICDPASVDSMLVRYAPDIVINTAAVHRVDDCEADPARAFQVNVDGARIVASRVPTIYISTDYVFTDKGPHEAVLPGKQPTSAYGRSKLAGELATLEQGGIVVRVAGVFGHHRSHKGPHLAERLLASHDPIRLPTDQRYSPTYAPDAATEIIDLAKHWARWKAGESEAIVPDINHASNRGSTTWAEFAENVLAVTGHDRHVIPYRAHDPIRPKDSSLVSNLPHWKDALSRWWEAAR